MTARLPPLALRDACDLAAFRERHADESVLVCSCGESARLLQHPEACITTGVNDIGHLFDPSYLVVVNLRNQLATTAFAEQDNRGRTTGDRPGQTTIFTATRSVRIHRFERRICNWRSNR